MPPAKMMFLRARFPMWRPMRGDIRYTSVRGSGRTVASSHRSLILLAGLPQLQGSSTDNPASMLILPRRWCGGSGLHIFGKQHVLVRRKICLLVILTLIALASIISEKTFKTNKFQYAFTPQRAEEAADEHRYNSTVGMSTTTATVSSSTTQPSPNLRPVYGSDPAWRRQMLTIEEVLYEPPMGKQVTPESYLRQYRQFLKLRAARLFHRVKQFTGSPVSGDPKKAVIVTMFRSGSSFLGELISSHPLAFYFFEPMGTAVRGVAKPEERLRMAVELLNCDFSSVLRARNVTSALHFQIQLNRLINNMATNMTDIDQKLWLTSQACALSPFRVLKTVRSTLHELQGLLEDPLVKIIFLARDPRGTLNSRDRRKWCWGRCNNTAEMCNDLLNNTLTAQKLHTQHPGRVKIIRIEEFLTDVAESTKEMFRFLDWPIEEDTLYFLMTRTLQKKGIRRFLDQLPYRENRGVTSLRLVNSFVHLPNSPNAVASNWRHNISLDRAEYAQTMCAPAMKILRYRIVHSEGQLRDAGMPLHYAYDAAPGSSSNVID